MRVVAKFILPVVVLVVSCHLAHRHPAPPEYQALLWIKKLQQAESRYYETYHRYGSLEDLGPSGAMLIEGGAVEGSHAGYRFTIERGHQSYVLRATPVDANKTSYYADQTGLIRISYGKQPATADSEVLR
ncbi:MAG: hypothetical protein JNN08_00425 [Bryobacterales bacterium]|nr:hypothetical protein [Bryobacterales bacterium]